MKKSIILAFLLFASSLIYAQGGWIQKANATNFERMGCFSFTIGSKLYIGGGDNDSNYLNDFWEYNPTTNVWTQKANYSTTGRRFGVGFSIGSKGYTGLGEADMTRGYSFSDFYEYNPSTNTWAQKANFPDGGRSRAVGVSSSTKGYISTGWDFNGNRKNDIWEYNPLNNIWTQKANLLNGKRYAATGFSANDMIFIGCGIDTAHNYLNDLWMYNPTNNTWLQKANLPGAERSQATGFSIGNYGFIGGGIRFSPTIVFSNFNKYNTTNNTWSVIPDLPLGISSSVGTSLNGKGYVGTGLTTDGRTNHFYEFDTLCGLSFVVTKSNIQCKGTNNGSITITAIGGTSPYQYSIDNGVHYQSSNSFSNLLGGAYTLIIKDVNNCISNTQNSVITEPDSILFTTTPVNVKCFGGNTGSIVVNASGGTIPLQYSKDNGVTWQLSKTFSNLSIGVYNVKVKDASNCITSLRTITINQPEVLAFSTSQINARCYGEHSGRIFVSATGGTGIIQYSGNDGSSFQPSNIFTGLGAGTYNVKIKDGNNCTTNSQSVIISEPVTVPQPSITTSGNVLTSSSASGNQWYLNDRLINGATNQSFTATQSGRYFVSVIDSNNCGSTSETFNFIMTAIGNNNTAKISVHPSPNNGLFFLDLDNVSISEIKILNNLGEIVYQSNKKVSNIDLSDKPKGVYLILFTTNGQIISNKIILQ